MLRVIIGALLMLALAIPASAGQPVTVTDQNNVPVTVTGGALSVNVSSTTGNQPTNINALAGTTLSNARGLPVTTLGIPNTPGQPCIGISTIGGTAVPSANQSVTLVASSTQQVVGLAASTVVHVCAFDISATLTAGATFSLEYGTGTLCAVGTTVFANYSYGIGTFDFGRGTGGQDLFSIPTGNAFCIASGAFVGTAFLNSGTSQY